MDWLPINFTLDTETPEDVLLERLTFDAEALYDAASKIGIKDKAMVSTFTFDEKTVRVIDSLRKKMGASSRVEVIRRALAFLDAAVTASGGEPVTLQTKTGPLRIAL